jgi:hypothetical protein
LCGKVVVFFSGFAMAVAQARFGSSIHSFQSRSRVLTTL